MTAPVLRLIGVTQQYGIGATAVSALSGVDLDVARGELVAIMGASGSGKSTLLSIAGGLAMPTTGEVVIEGEHLSTQGPKQLAALRRRSLGFVFQDFNLIPTLTALENVTLPLELDGFRLRVAQRAGRDALASVDLDIVAGFGMLAGAAAGILPPIGFAIQSQGSLRLGDVPWWLLVAFCVALPLVIAVATWLVPPRHPELTRRTAIA